MDVCEFSKIGVVNEDLTAELKRIQMEREKTVSRLNEINPRRSRRCLEQEFFIAQEQGPIIFAWDVLL